MPASAPKPRTTSAKGRILNASLLLFARMPMSTTSFRDIAAAAGVDVAYVHRSFGSKAELFKQALYSLLPEESVFTAGLEPDTLIERLCDQALQRDLQRIEDVQPFHLILQSCACNEARSIVVEFIETAFVRPLAETLGHEDIGRAMFAVSILSGLTNLRVVIGHPELQTIPNERLKAMLATALRGALLS